MWKEKILIFKKVITALMVIILMLLAFFLVGRYGGKLFGFSVCESAGIERVEVEDGQVRITGFYPGSFPEGFLNTYGSLFYIAVAFCRLLPGTPRRIQM